MGHNESTLRDILGGEHAELGVFEMFHCSHQYVGMKTDAIRALLKKHVKSVDLFYVATSGEHRYDMCLAFFSGGRAHSMVIHMEDWNLDRNKDTARSLITEALPPKYPARLALLDAKIRDILVLVDVSKVKLYAPTISWGPGGITCLVKLGYDWSGPYSTHTIVIDTWTVEGTVELMNTYNYALLNMRVPEKNSW